MSKVDKKEIYVLMNGTHTIPDGKGGIITHRANDPAMNRVSLSLGQYQNFKDKFKPLKEAEAEHTMLMAAVEAEKAEKAEREAEAKEAREKIQTDTQAELEAEEAAKKKAEEANAASAKAKAEATKK